MTRNQSSEQLARVKVISKSRDDLDTILKHLSTPQTPEPRSVLSIARCWVSDDLSSLCVCAGVFQLCCRAGRSPHPGWCGVAPAAESASSASAGLTDCSRGDILGVRYQPVNFGAKRDPASPVTRPLDPRETSICASRPHGGLCRSVRVSLWCQTVIARYKDTASMV